MADDHRAHAAVAVLPEPCALAVGRHRRSARRLPSLVAVLARSLLAAAPATPAMMMKSALTHNIVAGMRFKKLVDPRKAKRVVPAPSPLPAASRQPLLRREASDVSGQSSMPREDQGGSNK
ncbi:hypothetical protein EJB05_34647, partial [Eragrostis curvula]